MDNEAPAVPVIERTTVPASALFSEAELKPLDNPTPIAGENDTVLPPVKPADAPVVPAAAPVVADPAKPAAAPVVPAAAPVVPAAAPVVPAAAPEPKIKIGDKEYTKAELEQALAQRTAAAAPAPVVAAPVAEPIKPPTPEEIATAENSWQTKFIADEKLSIPVTEKELESILTGDKDGVAVLSSKLNSVVAKAVMLARKSVYQELNPVIAGLKNNLQPVLQNQQQVEAAAAEHKFFSAYPDFKGHSDTVRRVGEALFARFPQEIAKMTEEQILAEVAAQSDRIIQAECERYAPGKNWRQLQAAAPVIPAAPAPAAAPVIPAAPAPAAAPVIKAPGANSPASTGTGAGTDASWNKKTAASLAD